MLRLRLLSLLFWGFLGITSITLFPIAVLIWVVTLPFDPRKVVLHGFTSFWAALYTWFNPAWPLEIRGREKIERGRAYVMVSNHLSLIDIFVLFRLFRHFKWVSKIENFRLPFIGWNMALNRYIKLRRGDRASVAQMLRHCEEALSQGSSIMMFPEGTRSMDGKLRPFKPGAFSIAHKSRCPVLPIVIEGTSHALPKRGFVLQGRHPIRVTVLDAIPYEEFEKDSIEELTQRVRDRIAAQLGQTAS